MIDSNVWVNLHYTSLKLTKYYDNSLKDYNLTANQYILLGILETNTNPISTIAEILGVDRTTMSRNINNLVARGLVATIADPDKRKIVYNLTEVGKNILKDASVIWKDNDQKIINYLTPENVETVKQLLQFINQSLTA